MIEIARYLRDVCFWFRNIDGYYYASVSWSSILCCISSGVRKSMANFFFAAPVCESFFSSCCSISLTRFEYSWNDAASAYVSFLARALYWFNEMEKKNKRKKKTTTKRKFQKTIAENKSTDFGDFLTDYHRRKHAPRTGLDLWCYNYP